MKTLSRIFSVLCYGFMVYSAFTGWICGVSLCPPLARAFSFLGFGIPTSKYALYGYIICFGTLAGFIAAIILNILKCKWSSFFVLTGTAILRLYIAVIFFNRSRQIIDGVFVKHHVWIVGVAVFALLSTICYKKYRRDNSVSFEKTKKDQEKITEKLAEEETGASSELV